MGIMESVSCLHFLKSQKPTDKDLALVASIMQTNRYREHPMQYI